MGGFSPGINRGILPSESSEIIEDNFPSLASGILFKRMAKPNVVRYKLTHQKFGDLGTIWITFMTNDSTGIEAKIGRSPTKTEAIEYIENGYYPPTNKETDGPYGIPMSFHATSHFIARRERIAIELLDLFAQKLVSIPFKSETLTSGEEAPASSIKHRMTRKGVLTRVAVALMMIEKREATTIVSAAENARTTPETISKYKDSPEVLERMGEFRSDKHQYYKLRGWLKNFPKQRQRKDSREEKQDIEIT